jgi:hypothetical protein
MRAQHCCVKQRFSYYIATRKKTLLNISKFISMIDFRKGLFVFILLTSTLTIFGSELSEKLKSLPGVVSVEELKTTDFFAEKYLILFEQPLDASDPESPMFRQRVYLNHKSYNAPVVYITEGYNADYASAENYVNELSSILLANQICVEHRYFAESKPEPMDWQYLTTRGAADDHHAIRESLGNIYKGKWVSTGISKGGQTCLLYQMYYPKDVAATVAYVAPVAKALEDGRHEPFIKNIGTKKDQKRIVAFQKEILKRKAVIFPKFENYCKISKLTFRFQSKKFMTIVCLNTRLLSGNGLGIQKEFLQKKNLILNFFSILLQFRDPITFRLKVLKVLYLLLSGRERIGILWL